MNSTIGDYNILLYFSIMQLFMIPWADLTYHFNRHLDRVGPFYTIHTHYRQTKRLRQTTNRADSELDR